MDEKRFDWVPFYKELADQLLPYQKKRQKLIEKIRQIYTMTGISMPTLEQDDHIDDMDPFTVFGLFNKTSMKMTNRIRIIQAVAQLFSISAPLPTAFDSIPVLNNLNATFYPFRADRPADTMDTLWQLFVYALAYAKEKNEQNLQKLSVIFDHAMEIKYNGNSKITMGLYWIAPETFLNLDSRNKWYIYESEKLPETFAHSLPNIDGKLTAEIYFELTNKLRTYLETSERPFHSFMELSFEAWKYSQEVNEKQKAEKENKSLNAAIIQWFKPIIDALKDLGGSGTPEEVRNWIIEHEHLSETIIHEKRGAKQQSKFKNDVAWARNDLAEAGYIDRKVRGKWTLTEQGKTVEMTQELASKIVADVRKKTREKRINNGSALADEDVDITHYWLYSPGEGASMWNQFSRDGIIGIGWGEIGDLASYETREEMISAFKKINPQFSYKMDSLATWQFSKQMQPGDIVYVKKGVHQFVGWGIITSEYEYNPDYNDRFPNIRHVDWKSVGLWDCQRQLQQKTLTDITQYTDMIAELENLFIQEDEVPEEAEAAPDYPLYDEKQFLHDVYMDKATYDTLVGLVRTKKNIILQGAPGVGKTYTAKRLAYSMMGVKDQDRIMMVQFHQSYSYEDFIEGFRPASNGNGFEIKKGSFYYFCKKAADDQENEYFFIIDEINRGNLSKIFGELFMLIENDKRGNALQLLYSDEKFYVPRNVYIIGMMNTADRSLAMLDYALRRRFAFFDMKPGFESEGFRAYRADLDSDKFNRLIACVESLNSVITDDESLGEGFCIGHSYFCNLEEADDAALLSIVDYELAPLLREYWYDDRTKANDWINRLKDAIK